MAFDWAATGVIVTVIVIMCGVFYRLGKIETSKADKIDCRERAERCAIKFDAVSQAAATLNTAVARVQENQIAQEKLIVRQVDVVDQLEMVVNKGIRSGTIGNAKGATG